jgi:ABC-type antimicrobial peptide transport system permease subunit
MACWRIRSAPAVTKSAYEWRWVQNASRVVQMVPDQSFAVITIGVFIGVPLALCAAQGLASQLYGVSPWHPVPLAVAALVLLLVGMIASFLPSRTAARVDPLVAIRTD